MDATVAFYERIVALGAGSVPTNKVNFTREETVVNLDAVISESVPLLADEGDENSIAKAIADLSAT